MSEKQKVKLELPEGMILPEGCEMPEVELANAVLKRTIIGEDGKMIEVEETIALPIIEKEEK